MTERASIRGGIVAGFAFSLDRAGATLRRVKLWQRPWRMLSPHGWLCKDSSLRQRAAVVANVWRHNSSAVGLEPSQPDGPSRPGSYEDQLRRNTNLSSRNQAARVCTLGCDKSLTHKAKRQSTLTRCLLRDFRHVSCMVLPAGGGKTLLGHLCCVGMFIALLGRRSMRIKR